MLPSWVTLINATPPGRSTTACTAPAPCPSLMNLWKAARSTTTTTIQRSTSGTRGAPWTPSTSGQPRQQMVSSRRSPRMCRTQMEPWSSMLCSSSVSIGCSPSKVNLCWRTLHIFYRVLFSFPQLTGKRDFMIKWWTLVVSLLPAHTPLEFQWCIAQVGFSTFSQY